MAAHLVNLIDGPSLSKYMSMLRSIVNEIARGEVVYYMYHCGISSRTALSILAFQKQATGNVLRVWSKNAHILLFPLAFCEHASIISSPEPSSS